ncbi:hypothetical protein SD78_2863 [Bacillus badius]|nr:hypothetical protein SD78_2863 [Bacillus badius]
MDGSSSFFKRVLFRDAPKKGRVYQAAVTWKENGTSYTDTFRLD